MPTQPHAAPSPTAVVTSTELWHAIAKTRRRLRGVAARAAAEADPHKETLATLGRMLNVIRRRPRHQDLGPDQLDRRALLVTWAEVDRLLAARQALYEARAIAEQAQV